MPWKELSAMSQREEFVHLASNPGINFSDLCRRFDISRPCGYKWLRRHRAKEGVLERSRRPHRSPRRTTVETEDLVLAVIAQENMQTWGGRKIRRYLLDEGTAPSMVPAASTITGILRRRGVERLQGDRKQRDWKRFERDTPNDLWQMDFKGHFPLISGKRCYPLMIVDDHSRFAIGAIACANERFATVQKALVAAFSVYGLPRQIIADNGNPWGSTVRSRHGPALTTMHIWLLRLGVELLHSQPWHPETCGKCERLNQTLKQEVLNFHTFASLHHCQAALDSWRQTYNLKRPHDSLNSDTPVTRYRPSPIPFTGELAPVVYPPSTSTRTVGKGMIYFEGKQYQVGEALAGQDVGIDKADDGQTLKVYYCDKLVRTLPVKESTKLNPNL